METFLIKALQLILSLSILILIHEGGHFLFARLFKIKVEKFYLFFNPWFTLLKYKPKNSDTEYGIGWLPLGGYCKIAGMIDESMDKEQMAQPIQDWEFRAKPAWQRFFVMVGGVLFNFILALFIYSMVLFTWGDTYIPLEKTPLYFSEVAHQAGFQDGDILLQADGKPLTRLADTDLLKVMDAKFVKVRRGGSDVTINMPEGFMQNIMREKSFFADVQTVVIDSLLPGSAAKEAGLQKGDSLVSVNGVSTLCFGTFKRTIQSFKEQKAEIAFYRNGVIDTLAVSVDAEGKIGFAPAIHLPTETTHFGFFASIPAGIDYGISKLSFYVRQMKFVFTKEGASSLGGFGALGSIFPPVWDWYSFWMMTGFLSIMLAFMNVLPIPALDGGHIMFLIYEMIARRKPSEKFMENAQVVGMALLFGLLIFANGNDIYRFFIK